MKDERGSVRDDGGASRFKYDRDSWRTSEYCHESAFSYEIIKEHSLIRRSIDRCFLYCSLANDTARVSCD